MAGPFRILQGVKMTSARYADLPNHYSLLWNCIVKRKQTCGKVIMSVLDKAQLTLVAMGIKGEKKIPDLPLMDNLWGTLNTKDL